ncbi:hypothetical protein ACFL4T_02030 [candidate division KSB1 bacterium]
MFRKISYILIMTLLLSCSSQKIFFKKENFISRLNPDNDQTGFIETKLDTISTLTSQYNELKETDENSLKQKMDILSQIMDRILEIKNTLSEEQSKALNQTELVRYTITSARDLSIKYNKKYEIKDRTEIAFTGNNKLLDENFKDEWIKRSIRIGGTRSSNFGRSLFMGTPTFIPVIITATLLDKNLQSYLSEKNFYEFENPENIYIFISVGTYYHESYLDLSRWIIFLENEKEERSEYINFSEKKEPPVKRGRVGNFNLKYSGFGRNLFNIPDGRMQRSYDLSFRFKYKYYILEFRNRIMESSTKFLRFNCLEEIGSKNSDSGRWIFKY